MNCEKCAAYLQPGQNYCHVCNTPVSKPAQPAMPDQWQGYAAPQSAPYNRAPFPTPAAPTNTQSAAMPQGGQQGYQQNMGYKQAPPQQPQYATPAQNQVAYQQPVGNTPWQPQAYSQPAYGQLGGYPRQPVYGMPQMQPWQMQQPMQQNFGYGQAMPPKKWNPKKREKVLQNDVAEKKDTETGILSSVQCFVTILLGMIPIIGIFFSLFWINSMKSLKMKRNMAKGMLIIQGIVLVIVLVSLIIWVTGLGSALSSNFV